MNETDVLILTISLCTTVVCISATTDSKFTEISYNQLL